MTAGDGVVGVVCCAYTAFVRQENIKTAAKHMATILPRRFPLTFLL
jgi:hypothetical protein